MLTAKAIYEKDDVYLKGLMNQTIIVGQSIEHSSVHASIVIPCYNEEGTIGFCLDALINQEFDFPYEIIVVDDGSTNHTVEKACLFLEAAASRGISMRVIRVSRGGPARARNIGIHYSRGKYVLFIDADCEAHPYWLNILVKKISKDDVVGVGGPYRTKNSMNKIADYVGLELEYRHNRMKNTHIDFVRSANACFCKDVLMEVGGFNEIFTAANAEDSDLCFRILRRGYRLEWDSRAWVWHYHPSTIRHYVRQQFSRGTWRVLLYLKNPAWIKGDTYTGLETLVQPMIIPSTFLIMALTVILNLPLLAPIVLFMGLIMLISMNSKFLRWILNVRPSITFFIFCVGMLLLRSSVWTAGGVFGVIKFFPRLFRG